MLIRVCLFYNLNFRLGLGLYHFVSFGVTRGLLSVNLGYMLKNKYFIFLSLIPLLGLLLFKFSSSLAVLEEANMPSQHLNSSVVEMDCISKNMSIDSKRKGLLAFLWLCAYHHMNSTLIQQSVEAEDSLCKTINIGMVVFCLLFIAASLPSYGLSKYCSLKSIVESSSVVISWVKPIKGTLL